MTNLKIIFKTQNLYQYMDLCLLNMRSVSFEVHYLNSPSIKNTNKYWFIDERLN